MYKYILESIDQINWLAIIPLMIFFSFFCLTIFRVMKEKESFIKKMGQLPLEEE